MKKTTIALICLLCMGTSCKKMSKETANPDTANVEMPAKAESVTPQQLAEKWTERAIAVKGGGETPDVVTLLTAFNKVWNTQAVANLLAEAADTAFTESINLDMGSAITVDRKNGYAELNAGDSDDDCMGAGVWKCDNGHLLFALNVVTTQPDRRDLAAHQALCCYDYDPKTEVMKPVDNKLTQFKTQLPNTTLRFKMPEAAGVVRIGEVDNKGEESTLWHFLEWSGKDFVEYACYTDTELEEKVMGVWVNFDKEKPALTFNISRSDEEGMTVSDCGIYGSTEYDSWINVWEGLVTVEENTEEENTEENMTESHNYSPNPNLKTSFVLTRDGKLNGNFFMRQNGGKEYSGHITLQHGDPADALKP